MWERILRSNLERAMKLMKSLLPCLALALLITACGKSDDNQAVSVQPVGVAPFPQPYPYPEGSWPQIQGSWSYYFVNYQFSENGCTTGIKRFSGPNPEYVRQQLCSGLQNEWMNSRCAQSMRAAYFAHMCSGYGWSPH